MDLRFRSQGLAISNPTFAGGSISVTAVPR